MLNGRLRQGGTALSTRAQNPARKRFGPEHPDTATSLNNLAQLYADMGDYAKAEPLYQRALKINEKALGPEHQHRTCLDNLADFIKPWATTPKRNRSINARSKSTRRHSARNTPPPRRCLNGLALLYESMGDYAKAEPLYQRALKIREKALGPEHP